MHPSQLRDLFSPGQRIFVPGASGEPIGLMQAFSAVRQVEVVATFVPGINTLELEAIDPSVTFTGQFMHSNLRAAQQSGRYRHLPMTNSSFVKWVDEGSPFDVCVIQVSPPNASGECSLGPTIEYVPTVMRRSKKLVGIINPAVPFLKNAPTIARAKLDAVLETEGPLKTYDAGAPDAAALAISSHVAQFIEDGAAVQIGIGKAPAALMDQLKSRRRLRLHSGLLSDAATHLVEAGALDANWQHVATALVGSPALYDWAKTHHTFHVKGCEVTHAPSVLARIEGFVAVNSALEVDLFGQCNLEIAGGKAISGSGGAPDFAFAARRSHRGLSIVALSASTKDRSRILGRLPANGLTTLPRTDVDVVVTEHGAADLRGLSVHERAERIIQIAAPAFRSTLADQWKVIAAEL